VYFWTVTGLMKEALESPQEASPFPSDWFSG
jgi:hypothetical protein